MMGAGGGGGFLQGRGLDEAGLGLFGHWSPRRILSTVEGFSGYAVRHLKPEVTQNWRVGKVARRRGLGGWEEAAAGFLASQAYGPPSLRSITVLPQPEPEPGPLWADAPAFRLAVSDTMRNPLKTHTPGEGDRSCRTDTEFLRVPGTPRLWKPGCSNALLLSFAGTHSGALAPTTGREWPRPDCSMPRPLTRGSSGCCLCSTHSLMGMG